MRSEKLGLINNNGDYVLVNTDSFPYDKESNELLLTDDLLRDLKIANIVKKYLEVFKDEDDNEPYIGVKDTGAYISFDIEDYDWLDKLLHPRDNSSDY